LNQLRGSLRNYCLSAAGSCCLPSDAGAWLQQRELVSTDPRTSRVNLVCPQAYCEQTGDHDLKQQEDRKYKVNKLEGSGEEICQ